VSAAPGAKNWLMVLLVALIWGSSFMTISVAITGFGPLSVAAGRISLGALFLLLASRLLGGRLPSPATARGRRIWLAAAGFGVFSMALPFFLLSWAQARVSSGFAGVSMATVPLIVLPLAHLLLPGERMTLPRTAGFVIGFAGTVLLIGPDALQLRGADLEQLARLACLAAAASYAVGGIVTRLAPPVDPIAFAAGATSLAALLIVPVALVVEGWPENFPPRPALAVLYLAALPTAAANLLIVAVVRSAGPAFLSLANYQVPVWALIFGALFLDEALPAQMFAALALILTGLALGQHGQRRNAPPRRD